MYRSIIRAFGLKNLRIAWNTNCWSHSSPAAVVNTVSHSRNETCSAQPKKKKKNSRGRNYFIFLRPKKIQAFLRKLSATPSCEICPETHNSDFCDSSTRLLSALPHGDGVGSGGKGWMTQCKKCVIRPFLWDLCLPPPSLHTLITHGSATEYN